jgi:hypothetical protein
MRSQGAQAIGIACEILFRSDRVEGAAEAYPCQWAASYREAPVLSRLLSGNRQPEKPMAVSTTALFSRVWRNTLLLNDFGDNAIYVQLLCNTHTSLVAQKCTLLHRNDSHARPGRNSAAIKILQQIVATKVAL